MSVSIVMPCYNEEKIIEKVIKTYYKKIIFKIDDSEFIVVDDCSNDNTPEILKRLNNELPKLKILKTPINSGHGKAIMMGYETTRKEWVFQVDSDNQFEPEDFWKLYALKDKYDYILGFRKARHDPVIRLILTKIIQFTIFILFMVRIKDANCPFRLIKKETLFGLLKELDKEYLAPNIIISILAKKKRIKMAEVPVRHHARKTGINSFTALKLMIFAFRGFKQLLTLKI